jgi:crossover junction endodeoxyribonuclease RusA
MKKIIITSVPPSDNNVYRKRGGGFGMFLIPKGKDYKELVSWSAREAGIMLSEEKLQLSLFLFFKDKRRRDNTNYDKLTIDALIGIAYNDDSQIYRTVIEKKIGCPSDSEGIIIIIEDYQCQNHGLMEEVAFARNVSSGGIASENTIKKTRKKS